MWSFVQFDIRRNIIMGLVHDYASRVGGWAQSSTIRLLTNVEFDLLIVENFISPSIITLGFGGTMSRVSLNGSNGNGLY